MSELLTEMAYVSGSDGQPIYSRVVWDNQVLVVDSDSPGAARVSVPWPSRPTRLMMLSTTSLAPRPRPYHLPLELARGANFRVKTMLASMRQAGLATPEDAVHLSRAAYQAFATAATSQADAQASAKQADLSISLALETANQISQALAAQLISRRLQEPQQMFIGVDLQRAISLRLPANATGASAVSIPVSWKEVEPEIGVYQWSALDEIVNSCRDRKLHVCLGPLIALNSSLLPEWVQSLDPSSDQFHHRCLAWVQSAVERYAGKISIWNCASVGSGEGLAGPVAEESMMSVTAACVETVRVLDERSIRVISVDDPWMRHVARRELLHSPSTFVAALRRADAGLSAILLNFHFGRDERSLLPRDPLELLYRIDLWSNIGAPLVASVDAAGLFANQRDAQEEDRRACQYATAIIGLIAARPVVQGVFFTPVAAESAGEILAGAKEISHEMDRRCWDAFRPLLRSGAG